MTLSWAFSIQEKCSGKLHIGCKWPSCIASLTLSLPISLSNIMENDHWVYESDLHGTFHDNGALHMYFKSVYNGIRDSTSPQLSTCEMQQP